MSLNPRAPQFRTSKSPCVVKESEDTRRVSTPLAYEFPYTLQPIPLLQTPYLASPTSVSPYPNRYSPQQRDSPQQRNSPYPNGMFDGRMSEQLPQFTSIMSDYTHRPYPQPVYHRMPMLPPGLPIYVRQ
jgi:hypothetical protein